MATVFIGLGANLEDPEQQLITALNELAVHPDLRLLAYSSLYSSKPVGPQDQPDYVNAVAKIETNLEPEPLLDVLQAQENMQGRVRLRRWGERTLDLDILLYGQQMINSERLTIPHPELKNRNFVVVPLVEISPNLTLPDGIKISECDGNRTNDISPISYPQIDI
ncbi:MAG: 2-amino-4-hydroxy-6-hydroxymethyldihydropteridine diphosphokinase [Oceanobacter sp.]